MASLYMPNAEEQSKMWVCFGYFVSDFEGLEGDRKDYYPATCIGSRGHMAAGYLSGPEETSTMQENLRMVSSVMRYYQPPENIALCLHRAVGPTSIEDSGSRRMSHVA